MTAVSLDQSYTFRQLRTHLKTLLDLRDANQVEVIESLRTISTSYCLSREVTRVGIRLFYNQTLDFLTTDSKTEVVQKAIDNVETLLTTRTSNSGKKFKDSSFSASLFFTQLNDIARRLARTDSILSLKNLHREFGLVVLDSLSLYNGISDFSAEHPLWTYSARNISVSISLEHYQKAHHLTKLYGFRNCSVLMSFALTEYFELLKMKKALL